jgi:hypothetical protein
LIKKTISSIDILKSYFVILKINFTFNAQISSYGEQSKRLFIHLIILVISSLFLFTANHLLNFHEETNWWIWVVVVWSCIFIFHVIKVLITDSFMNKNWERAQIDKLMLQQTKKIEKLKNDLDNSKPSAE